jgi:alpha-N-arabinofuranosidase
MDFISEHFYDGVKQNMTEHAWQIPNSIRRIAVAHRKYRNELPNFKNVIVPIALDEWNYWSGEQIFGEAGVRYFMKDGLGIAAGIHEFARQSDMYFMANYAQTVNVLGCIKTSQTAAKMETTGLVLELYRKHFGNSPVKTELEPRLTNGNPIDVQAALTESGELTIGIVNTLAREVTITPDIQKFDVTNKKFSRFEIADPQNDPNGFNDPDKPYRIEIQEIKGATFNGKIIVNPYSVTLLKFM